MPIMVVAAIAIAAASTAAALAAAGVAMAVAIGVGLAVGAAMAIMSLSMQPSVPRIQSPDSASSLGTTTDPSTVIPTIYGESRTGAINVFKAVNGTDSKGNYLVQCFAISQGEVDAIKQIYMDNKKILLDNNLHVDGIVPKAQIAVAYQNILQVEISTGKNPGRHLSLAKKYIGNEWPDNFTGNGIATMCIVMHKTNKALTDGVDILQPNSQVAVELNGKKITNLINGNKEFTRNAPSCLLDFLISPNGLNTPIDRIDLDSFKVAAARTDNIYWCDGGTDPNASNKANIENICSSFGGIVFDSFGKLTLKLDAPDVTKYHFDEDNIVMSEISLTDGGTSSYYNTLNVSFNDPKIDYSSTVLRYPSDAQRDALIKKDKRVIAKDITMRFSKNVGAIDKLASIERNKALMTHQISFSTADAFTLEVWDVISVTNKELQLNNKLFRVLSITPMMDTGTAGTITVTAGEYDSLVYSNQDLAAKPNYDPISVSTSIYQPFNLAAVNTGETVYGSNVLVTWECNIDYNRYQFYIQYKKSSSTEWLSSGNTSEYEFTIMGLQTGVQYDFRVCAAGLYYQSPWTELSNPNLTVQYLLPAPVVRLRNGIALGSRETRHQAFDLEWDDQSKLDVTVNGVKTKFVDLFDYYEIEVTQKNRVFTYRTKDINWIYTYEMNAVNGLSRNVKFGIRAIGFGGRKSNQTVVECFNAQAPALLGFSASPGFGTIFVNWNQPDPVTVPDYAGVVVQVAQTAGFTGSTVKTFTAPNASEIHTINLDDGNWYVRVAAYDVFGQDAMIYTAAVMVQLQSRVNWTQQDSELIKEFLNLEHHLEAAVDQAFERSKDAIQLEISNLHTNVTNERNQAIAAASTRMEQIVKDGDKVVVDALNQVKVTIDKDIKSEITGLNTVIASNNQAQSQALQTVKSEINGNIAQVSTNAQTAVDALKNTVNSKYTVKVNANGVVTGMTMVADSTNDKSAIYFNANEFFVISNSSDPSNPVIPFAVQNSRVFLNSAVIANASIGAAHITDASIGTAKIIDGSITNGKIQNAAITNGKISGTLSSQNAAGWALYQDGSLVATKATITGTVNANAGVFNNVTIAGNCDIQGTLRANQIVGDMAVQGILPAVGWMRPPTSGTWTTVARQVYTGQGTSNIIVSVPNVNCHARGGTGSTTGGFFEYRVLVNGNVICNERIDGGTNAPAGQFSENSGTAKTTMGGAIKLNNVTGATIELQIFGAGYVGSYPTTRVDAVPVIVNVMYRNAFTD